MYVHCNCNCILNVQLKQTKWQHHPRCNNSIYVQLIEQNIKFKCFSTCYIISFHQQFVEKLLALTVVSASFVVGINTVVVTVVLAFLAEGLTLLFLIQVLVQRKF